MNKSIGIFDSGFGGLTVMRAIRKILPHENIIYFGDTAHLPYGTKSREKIVQYSLENAAFLIEKGIKALVVACHTASSFALDELEKKFDLPILGVIAPAIEQLSSQKKIGILGTQGTVASGTYQKAIQKKIPHAEVSAVACQLLVHLVEEGFIDHPITQSALHEYLQPLKEFDTLVLGCTHFPLLQHQIQQALPQIQLIDPAEFCAASVKKLLMEKQLLNSSPTHGHNQFFVSDAPEKFRRLGETFLGSPIPTVSLSIL